MNLPINNIYYYLLLLLLLYFIKYNVLVKITLRFFFNLKERIKEALPC